MKNPAGIECKHYYEDFNRFREIQECRLSRLNPESIDWQPDDCGKCPVPAILRANGSPNMELILTIKRGFLGIGRQLRVDAFCQKHQVIIDEPPLGCIQCNAERPNLAELFGANDS